ncbi:MAG: VirB3 family type IV secretion system protein [Sphingomonadales bacterium]|nr:VirB3 family type IV secretion system protein [Sphingomonadales bacterium]MBK6492514.1 VirB3 family type IV secretion system protein [Sphingomonadales bacterium]MBK6720613.1 VirB3 family type IV secretion system protein [Sphingomonadales bacterium]MBK8273798.1 VirB3 family type IV secretion system protein [Sphingomonadales bacterium]MBK8861196.1 VirB3 family type IV secretion system protein [Sphingomonadales bacterium]
MEGLQRDRLFVALTRPQMFAGVTYSYFVINFVVAAELFLLFRSIWVIVPALLLHGLGVLLCLNEPRSIDLWLTRASKCGRVRNHGLWRCNSYRP